MPKESIEKKARVSKEVKPKEIEPVSEAVKEAPAVEVAEVPTSAPLEEKAAVPSAPLPAPQAAPLKKDPVFLKVESILSEGLKDLYANLPEDVKPKFKAKGEETAQAIRAMLAKAKLKARKVLKMIRNWLGMIPGVNKFFLEQEAAIKTQKIIELSEEKNKK